MKKEILKHEDKDVMLFLGRVTQEHLDDLTTFSKKTKRPLKPALITSRSRKLKSSIEKQLEFLIRLDARRYDLLEKHLLPHKDRIAGIISRFESTMPLYGRLSEIFPYLRLPTRRSLEIASDKVKMRKAFRKYDQKITPKFLAVHNSHPSTLKKIEKRVGFPCVVKPANLSKSQLVTVCYYEEELEQHLTRALRKIATMYKKSDVQIEPTVLVEQFMEGQMYSIDAYINSRGYMDFTPVIEIKTGKDIGHDDFFMYTQIVPSILDKKDELKARAVVRKATHAVGLRSSTVHAELMKTTKGWKVIEIGARVGGFRDRLLGKAFGLNHTGNDFLVHLGKKPILRKRVKKHVAFIKFYPRTTGKLTALKGIKKVTGMSSVFHIRQNKKVGDFCGLSRYGHPYVLGVTLATDTRSKLLGELRKVEKAVEIKTEK